MTAEYYPHPVDLHGKTSAATLNHFSHNQADVRRAHYLFWSNPRRHKARRNKIKNARGWFLNAGRTRCKGCRRLSHHAASTWWCSRPLHCWKRFSGSSKIASGGVAAALTAPSRSPWTAPSRRSPTPCAPWRGVSRHPRWPVSPLSPLRCSPCCWWLAPRWRRRRRPSSKAPSPTCRGAAPRRQVGSRAGADSACPMELMVTKQSSPLAMYTRRRWRWLSLEKADLSETANSSNFCK